MIPIELKKDNTSLEEKNERLHRLNEVVNKWSNLRNHEMLGKTVKCLVLSLSEKDNTKYMGYTENMKLVNITSNKNITGKIVDVKIDEAKSFSLNGTYIEK